MLVTLGTAEVDTISLDELCPSRMKRVTKTALLTERLLHTLGTRDFSCIVSGFGQVVIVTHSNWIWTQKETTLLRDHFSVSGRFLKVSKL